VTRRPTPQIPAWEVLAAGSGQRGVEGRAKETESERELGIRLLGAARSGKRRTREHNRREKKEVYGQPTAKSGAVCVFAERNGASI
jgi:hypothetical protein